MVCHTTEAKRDTEACYIDELAHQFTQWFYAMLNHQGTQLGVGHFWQDCNMQLVLNSEMGCYQTEVKSSAANVVQVICNTKTQHNLYFSPNLSHGGVKGKADDYGLVMVVASGTLHQPGRCVGVFEQLFGLVRDPFAGNWKIKHTKLHLKTCGGWLPVDLPSCP
jgi:hypothetical protein